MNEIDLINYAAKAAGYEQATCYPASPADCEPHAYARLEKGVYFRPLSDLRDAMELLIRLSERNGFVVSLSIGMGKTGCEFNFVVGPDPRVNTCRAITVAAAAVGEKMEAREAIVARNAATAKPLTELDKLASDRAVDKLKATPGWHAKTYNHDLEQQNRGES